MNIASALAGHHDTAADPRAGPELIEHLDANDDEFGVNSNWSAAIALRPRLVLLDALDPTKLQLPFLPLLLVHS